MVSNLKDSAHKMFKWYTKHQVSKQNWLAIMLRQTELINCNTLWCLTFPHSTLPIIVKYCSANSVQNCRQHPLKICYIMSESKILQTNNIYKEQNIVMLPYESILCVECMHIYFQNTTYIYCDFNKLIFLLVKWL